MFEKTVLKLKYFYNDFYNARYIKQKGITDYSPVTVSEMENSSPVKELSAPFMTVWLLNIKRLIEASPFEPGEFEFMDIGCGKGISTIYVHDKFDFKSVAGFDFEHRLVASARENANRANCQEIEFFEADASKLILESKRWFLFMFNPFNEVVLRLFLENNIQMLKETRSLLAYANCRHLDVIREFKPQCIHEIPAYRCALIQF